MADYNISAEITANTKGFESGVKKAQASSKKLSNSIASVVKGFGKSGLSGAITSAGLALGGIGLAIGTAVKAVKGITKALGECAEAYKVQLQAERALDTAINNSPFVSGTASKALKDYASQLQKVSNLGDEEIIPQMTQLVATGRTEAEVMKIIATASDMSASGAMSFDQAVTQLNATLNGNIGRLGQQNAELKALTKEELESGKAVEILGEKYKGLAKATVDTKKQLQNAIGDLKESFGSVFENAVAPMRKFFTELIQGWADARKAKQAYEESTKDVAQGKGDIEDFENVIAGKQKELEDLKWDLNALLTDDWGFPVEEAIRIKNEEIEQAERELEILKAQLDNKIEQQEIAKKQAEEENKRIETEKTVADLKGEYLEKIAEQERKWKNIQSVTGEQVANEEKIKFYQDSLVDLMTQAGGQITTNNQLYKDQIAIIQKLQAELKPEEKETSDTWAKKIREQAISRLEAEKEAELERLELRQATEIEIFNATTYYNEKLRELNRQRIEEERQQALKSVENYANALEEKGRINQYYNNQLLDNTLKFMVKEKTQSEEIPKNYAEGFKKVVSSAKDMAKKVAKIFSELAKTIKKIFSTGKSIFSKLFDFDLDKSLDNVLAFEDKVLTFFVETLPKLPQFVASVMQSISVLIQNILNSGGLANLGDILISILSNLVSEVPRIIKAIVPVIKKIINAVFQTLTNMNIFENLLDMIVEGFEWLLNSLVSALPSILKGLIGFIEKVLQKLPQIIKIILPAITKIITSVVKALPSLLKAVIPNVLKAVLELVRGLLRELPTIITVLINALPEIISAVIEGLSEFLASLSGKDIALFISGIIKATTQIATALVTNIGKIVAELIPFMVHLVIELIKSIPDIIKGLATGVWEGVVDIAEDVWNGLKWAGESIKNVGESIIDGIKGLFGFANGTNDAPRGLALVGEAGPELVRFNGGEQVLNTRNTQKALASVGSNSGNQFNVTFNNTIDTTAYALMQQLKQYNRQMAINGVI